MLTAYCGKVSLGLLGGAGLCDVYLHSTVQGHLPGHLQADEPRAALEKWNQPGKVRPGTTVLHNTGATEPVTADLHYSCLGLQPSHRG